MKGLEQKIQGICRKNGSLIFQVNEALREHDFLASGLAPLDLLFYLGHEDDQLNLIQW